jgi:hypothetical protein
MLTLKSKFSDYVEALRKAGACADVVAIHDEMLKKNPDLTVGDVYKGFSDDPNFEDGWAYWVLELMGKELDVKIREIAINKIKDPFMCLRLAYQCPYFSESEILLLKSKYDAENADIAKAIICLDAIVKSREFNLVRAEAVTTCKSVTEAKTLIETKIGVATTISADSVEKSPDAIKTALETERTKITLATNEVMRSQGFVDEKGSGSVSVFESWLEGV